MNMARATPSWPGRPTTRATVANYQKTARAYTRQSRQCSSKFLWVDALWSRIDVRRLGAAQAPRV
jgi:hypothetical protein